MMVKIQVVVSWVVIPYNETNVSEEFAALILSYHVTTQCYNLEYHQHFNFMIYVVLCL
jgi:hypothetical protein